MWLSTACLSKYEKSNIVLVWSSVKTCSNYVAKMNICIIEMFINSRYAACFDNFCKRGNIYRQLMTG